MIIIDKKFTNIEKENESTSILKYGFFTDKTVSSTLLMIHLKNRSVFQHMQMLSHCVHPTSAPIYIPY